MLIGDSAYPLATYPTTFEGQPVEGWCVYIGGDAYHVWTDAEFAALRAQPHIRYILPIYVRSNPQGAAQAASDVAAAIVWAKAHGQPRGTLTQWDYETADDAVYEEAVSRLLLAGDGDLELLYGSKSTVTQNPVPAGGYQIADWTDAIPASLASTAQQFYGGASDDMSSFRAGAALWDTRPTAPTPAPPAPTPTEDDVNYFPIQTGPDPAGTSADSQYACGGASWPAGAAHVLQILADPGLWGDTAGDGQFRLVFSQLSGPDVATTAVGTPAESIAVEFKTVTGLNPGACRGVTITRPDGKRWPWYGHAE